MQSIVKARRTDCITGNETEVLIGVVKLFHGGSLNSWWYEIIKGGVTGYESCSVEDFDPTGGWSACAGTKYRWDTLYVPEQSCRHFIEELKDD